MILRLLYSTITTLLLIATHGQSCSMETTSVYDAPKYSRQMEDFRRHSPMDHDSNIRIPECPRPYSKIDFVDSLVEHKRDSYEIKVKTLSDSLSFDNIAPVEKIKPGTHSILVNLSTVDELFGEYKRFDPVLKVDLSSLKLDRLDLYESQIKVPSYSQLLDRTKLTERLNLETLSIGNLGTVDDHLSSKSERLDSRLNFDLSSFVTDRLDLYERKIRISSDYQLFDRTKLTVILNLETLPIGNLCTEDKLFSECKWFDPGTELDLPDLILASHKGGNEQTAVGRAMTSSGSFYIPILLSCMVCVLNIYSTYS